MRVLLFYTGVFIVAIVATHFIHIFVLFFIFSTTKKNKREGNYLNGNTTLTDMVNHPPHYTSDPSGIECCKITDFMMFNGGNCFKYLYRLGNKDAAIQELGKAAWYASRAWVNDEVVNEKAVKGIREVLRYRDGNVCKAMQMIKVDMWADAERHIRAEIERLESQQ